ncbi:MAG TPA: gliding motility-associated C-terminal domain-containing protein [Chitinophagales bacterium]|nr:gliding motility-associated C-terminal domain-containing protein [Chitinophagales bacterium]
MLRKTLPGLLLLCGVFSAKAQLVISSDTTLCETAPVTLEVISAPSYGTTSYTFVEADYAPEAYAGTTISLSDDSYGGPYSIGFTFCFLGNEYTQFYVGSNGWLSFGGAGALTTTFTSAPIPSVAGTVPKNCIMGPWADWHPGLCAGCIKYQTIGTAPNRKLVLSFDNVPMYSCTTTYGKFQIVLHETTNIIENHITNKDYCAWAGGTATQGVHNLSGTVAFTVPGRNSTVWTADDETVQFVPSGITWYSGATIIGYGDSIVVTPGVTTTYTAEVESCDGTVYTADVTVAIELDDPTFTYADTEFCPDDVITPTYIATPGGTFVIDPPDMPVNAATGQINLSGGEPGTTYTVEYTTPPGICSSSSGFSFTIVPYDDATVSYASPSFCPTGTASPTVATPGGTYTIAPAGMSINPTTGVLTLSTGTVGTTYTVTYTTAGFCPSVATTTVLIDPLDDPTFAYDSASYCPSGFALPTVVTGGGTFTASPGSLTIDATTGEINLSTGIPGTTYTITYTTPAGSCSNFSTETVTINYLDVASFGYSASSYCAGGTVSPTFITTPGGSFTVTPSGLDVDPVSGDVDLTTGTVGITYAITYTTDSGPCSNSGTVSITIDPNDDSTFYYTAPSFCAAGSAVPVVVTPGGNFVSAPAGLSINPASGTVDLSSSTPGTYTITYTTPAGFCSSSMSQTLTVTDFTDAFFEYDTVEYCNEGSVMPFILNPGGTFSAPGSVSIDISTGEIDLGASVAGGPYQILYNSPGCTEQDTFFLTIHPMPSLTIDLPDLTCYEDDPILLSGTPAGGFFSGTGVTGNIFLPGAVPAEGLYPVTYTYTNEFGCTSELTEYIQVILHTVSAGPDQTIIEGQYAVLEASDGVIFTWDPADWLGCSGCQSTSATPPLGTMNYLLTSYDENGCVAFDMVNVTVIPFDDVTVFVPNTFTPNGDHINDYLMPYGSDVAGIISFTVYDRWGEIVWQRGNIAPDHTDGGWNGTSLNGQPLNAGVYAYAIEVYLSFGVTKTVYGNVTLIR